MADNLTKILQEAIQRKKSEREYLDVKMFAKEFSKELAKSISPDNVSKNIELQISKSLVPLLQKLIEKDSFTADAIANAISNIKIPDVYVDAPKIDIPPIPQPKVNVFPPEVKVPPIVMPKEMDIKGWVSLMGVDLQNPLPVQLRDAKGNPVNLLENLTTLISTGGGGGGFRRIRVDNPTSEPVNVQIVSGAGATSAVNVVDSSGVGYSGSNPLPVTITSGATATTAVYNLNADGTYRNTFPVQGSVTVSGSLSSTVAVGDIVSDASDTGSAPVKTGGIARTANPTAVSGGDRVSASYDDLGRQLVRPFQVRDLMATAYATITDSSEDTLLAGSASTFHDLVYIMGANESDSAVSVDIRTGTGGSVVMSLEIPANSTAGVAPSMPIPQTEVAQAWTVQNPGSDISNTTVNITALFNKEV